MAKPKSQRRESPRSKRDDPVHADPAPTAGRAAGDSEAAQPESSRSAISLIRELQSGRIVGAHLTIADRRRVVEHLTAEGYNIAEIAEVVKVADRTVMRDRDVIREQNALHIDPSMTPRVVGQLVTQAETSVSRLRRLARDKDSPAAVRVEAELGAWKVANEAVQTMQRLGYLPTAAQQVQGQFVTTSVSIDADGELSQLQTELTRLHGIVAETSGLSPGDDAHAVGLEALFATAQQKLQIADARATVSKLSGEVAQLQKRELVEPADEQVPPAEGRRHE